MCLRTLPTDGTEMMGWSIHMRGVFTRLQARFIIVNMMMVVVAESCTNWTAWREHRCCLTVLKLLPVSGPFEHSGLFTCFRVFLILFLFDWHILRSWKACYFMSEQTYLKLSKLGHFCFFQQWQKITRTYVSETDISTHADPMSTCCISQTAHL